MLALFTGAILAAAFLLFLVQPMAAKIVLPKLGGAPSVWIASMLFFQAALLAGYFYTHALTKFMRVRVQVLIHGVLLGVAALTLPPPTDLVAPGPSEDPVAWLLRTLSITVGLPFFVVATTSPLVQRWFSYTGHATAKDPYFLYAASNIGNMAGLLAYPLVLEPLMGLKRQTHVWSIGFGLLLALVLASGIVAIRRAKDADLARAAADAPSEKVTWAQRARWTFLAFVPSSLLLGVTLHITTDVGSLPLIWALPLLLYLLSFVFAFSTRVRVSARALSPLVITGLVVVAGSMLLNDIQMPWLNLSLHLLVFLLCAWMCHKLLSDARPGPSGLTEFYLWLSVGGVLGGIANGVLAPRIFNTVLEYPLVLGLAALCAPSVRRAAQAGSSALRERLKSDAQVRRWWRGPIASVLIGVALAFVMLVLILNLDAYLIASAKSISNANAAWARALIPIGLLVVLLLTLGVRRTAPALLVALIATQLLIGRTQSLHRERTFFGVHEVITSSNGAWRVLRHGTTNHGIQQWIPEQEQSKAKGYYSEKGPAADVFRTLAQANRLQNVAILGMGAGGLVSYGVEGSTIVFYEIDPAVIRIGGDPKYFTYIARSKARVGYVEGDGRIMIAQAPEASYDLIVLDAFSSDSIPTHLLTYEALRDVYVPRLKPDGVLLVHISNRYFDLLGPVAKIGHENGLWVLMRDDRDVSPEETLREGRQPTRWIAMARNRENFAGLESKPGWMPIKAPDGQVLWTDDYTNLLGALKR